MMSFRTSRNKPRALAALGALAAVLACGVAVSPSASAAAVYPTCNTTKAVSITSGHSVTVPAYGSSKTMTCKLVLNQTTENPAVKALQRSLTKCEGYAHLGVPDGYYGPQTFLAVEALQDKYGLFQDGIYGPDTRDSMRHYSSTLGCARL
ncbi:peptidoglycan-binding protein [Streptomyces sp. ISL-111]|uniref:peptidoglycan-binding domain-containing protein n=1 Tax=Streptomyces sp. ISL-111 TaxID=2819175 RepID=UPI001BEA6D54|nr:peptidoglycan-binding domain-containing protein [Streptomyces sp. ISL-111]MBT2380811.1 peptidoglycan-binding protein [Streptomyces sp. ISL-111]